jgi:hypothetical protein
MVHNIKLDFYIICKGQRTDYIRLYTVSLFVSSVNNILNFICNKLLQYQICRQNNKK